MPKTSFSFAYPRSDHGINIRDLEVGSEPTVVLGVNGAGKTTMLRCLAGQLPLRTGGVPDWGRTVYVAQKFQPIRGFSVVEYISYVGWLQGAPRAQAQQQAPHWAEFAGLGGGLLSRECRQLSGGQQSKLQLASALNSDAQVLLLDEPSAALDPIAKQEIKQLYSAVIAQGITLWVSSHQPLEVGPPFEQVIVIDQGELVFQGPIASFMALGTHSSATWRDAPISPTVRQLSAIHGRTE